MKKLYGITVALITPMNENQEVDYDKLSQLVEMLVKQGVNCIYCCGTDAEMYHLTMEERKKIAETVVKATDKRVVVYVHCGAMMQSDTIELVKHAEKTGADGIGVVTPSYYPMTDEALVKFYTTIAKSVDSNYPVYIYNIPQLAVNDIKASVVQKIVDKCKNVVGIKYNYPDINKTLDFINVNNGDFSVLQGDDRVVPAWLALGCSGTVAGSANVFPEPLVKAYKAFKDGDLDESLKNAKVAARFIDAMENDDIAYFKAGLALRGFDVGPVREPLMGLDETKMDKLKSEFEKITSDNDIELNVEA